MIFKIYNSDFGVTIRGVNYDFDHVDSLTIEDPERTRITRGANAKNKKGLVFKEGVKEAKVWTVAVMGVPADLLNLLRDVYEKEERVDVYCVDRSDGSGKIGKNAVLSQAPQQLTIDETAESLNIVLVFETFDHSENHKS